MTAERRGQPELHVRLPSRAPAAPPSAALPELPPVSALFLIEFDVKAGYTISWKASRPGLELEGVVEYKSLPSGLHTVSEDLIYFVHENHAGLSAFVNAPCEDTELRNARMLAVGVLVPLSFGRLGRAWKHAEGLKAMASNLVANAKDTTALEEYWAKHQARDHSPRNTEAPQDTLESPVVQPRTPGRSRQRNRSASDGAGLLPPGHRLSSFHPAWSLSKLLDTFGPLIFPIHRAALLRKRILISCHAPVQEVNDFVYDISILSNIPLSTYENLLPGCPSHRLNPLFTIGVHDIPFLAESSKPARPGVQAVQEPEGASGWIACTTDSILAMKDTLWDMLVTLPPPHSAQAHEHVWPTVECPRGVVVKATQRDLRRYRALRTGLSRMAAQSDCAIESPTALSATPLTPTAPRTPLPDPSMDDADKIVEPPSWAALAYNGFMWWASAGEQTRADEVEESAHDAALLADLYPSSMHMSMSMPRSADPSASGTPVTPAARRLSTSTATLSSDEAQLELAIIAYFHRLTSAILDKLTDIIDDDDEHHGDASDAGSRTDDDEDVLLGPSAEEEGEGEIDGRGVRVSNEALRAMGLDIWSASDVEFVKEVVSVYFDRHAFVEGKVVEVCGVRVC